LLNLKLALHELAMLRLPLQKICHRVQEELGQRRALTNLVRDNHELTDLFAAESQPVVSVANRLFQHQPLHAVQPAEEEMLLALLAAANPVVRRRNLNVRNDRNSII
jgi:hypothetical protein